MPNSSNAASCIFDIVNSVRSVLFINALPYVISLLYAYATIN